MSQRIGVWVALADVMINFLMTALLFAMPRQAVNAGGEIRYWISEEVDYAPNEEYHLALFSYNRAKQEWYIPIYRSEPNKQHDWAVLCLEDGILVLPRFREKEWIPLEDEAMWLEGIHTDEQVFVFVVDDICRQRVADKVEFLGSPGTYVFMASPPQKFLDAFASDPQEEEVHESE